MGIDAYILINCEMGNEDPAIEFLRGKFREGLKGAKKVYGVYDIVAEVNAENEDALRSLVKTIREDPYNNKIRSTLTLVVVESSQGNYKVSDEPRGPHDQV